MMGNMCVRLLPFECFSVTTAWKMFSLRAQESWIKALLSCGVQDLYSIVKYCDFGIEIGTPG